MWRPSSKNAVYSISKYGVEREVWRGMEEGLNAVIICPSVILGPGYWHKNSGFFQQVWEGLRYTTRGVTGYVDVRDVSRIMIGIMDKGIFGERFICSSNNLSYQEFFTLVAKYLNKPSPAINVPPAMTIVAWAAESFRAFITRSRPRITREMAIASSRVDRYSNEKIKKSLDFEFIPIEQSIRDICGSFLKDQSNGSA